MEIKTNEYRVWTDGATIYYEGTMRLSGSEAYAPIQAMMDQVLAAKPALITLDLTELEFLNSSGINLLAKFTIEVRNRPHHQGHDAHSVAAEIAAQPQEAAPGGGSDHQLRGDARGARGVRCALSRRGRLPRSRRT